MDTATLPASATPYPIAYGYAGDANFQSASDSTTTLTVNTAPLTVTATGESMIVRRHGAGVTYTYTGFVNGDTASVFSGGRNNGYGGERNRRLSDQPGRWPRTATTAISLQTTAP